DQPKVVQTTMALDKPVSKVTTTSRELGSPPGKSKPKTDGNQANDFSNIGFVMNPTYAKRHNISPEIVEKKNMIVKAYVSRYVPVAKIEQNLYGIPTSITLAQGLLESDAGHSRLAKQNNNHFGIKCFSRTCAKGHCANFTDDSHKDFFRVYKSAWESYREHSLFLQKPRYKHLLDLPPTDYKAWAKGLSKAGYATDKRYADKLITLIEALNLHQYDK
ncbi:MAG: glycoside hydrolase family 73 protein, partial [Saprospiraceae bacterium]